MCTGCRDEALTGNKAGYSHGDVGKQASRVERVSSKPGHKLGSGKTGMCFKCKSESDHTQAAISGIDLMGLNKHWL